MIKKFNYTGRQRIPHAAIQLRLDAGDEETVHLTLDREALTFPEDSRIFLDAYTGGTPATRRFDFGPFGDPIPPEDCGLGDWSGRPVFFTLRIVGEGKDRGRLLGLAEHLRPKSPRPGGGETARESLLPVMVSKDLGKRIWDITFEHDMPWLLLNEEIPRISERIRTDPIFFSLVFPEIVEKVLTHILDEDRTNAGWAKWLKWGQQLHPDGEPPPDESDSTAEDYRDWAREIAQAFAQHHDVSGRYRRELVRQDDEG